MTCPVVVRITTPSTTCPSVVRVTTSQGPPGVGLPAGIADAGKFVRKLGASPYLYELVTPDQVGLPQGLAPSSSPTFVGLTLSGIAQSSLLYTGPGGAIGSLSLGSGLSIVGGALTVTGGGSGGTVTSVGLSMPTGFAVANSPVTGAGALAVTFAAGYGLPTTASQASWDTAAGLAATAIQPGNAALTDAREWIAVEVTQAEAEAGIATTPRKWTALRVRQAIAAWFSTVSGVAGRAILLAADSAAQRLLLGLGTTDSPSFAGLTITGTAAVSIPHIHGGIAGPNYIHCKSAHSALMTKGTPVHIVGSVGDTDVVEVIPADAADPTKMPAVGLLDADVAPNGNGHVVVGGELLALSTAGYSQGEAAWVAAGGGLTATRPTTGLAQQVATVGRVHATTGSVTVVPGTALVAAIAAQTATANVVLAGPTAGAAAAPTFRALVADDIPGLSGTNTGDISLSDSVADVLSLSGQILLADDPGSDRLLFWDESEGRLRHLTLGTNLSINDTTLDATGGGAAGEVRCDASTVTTIYVGRAAANTAESSPGWAITRTTYSALGVLQTTAAASGAWINRTSLTYA